MNSKKIVRLILYFLPVMMIHVVFIVLSKKFQIRLASGNAISESIDNLLHVELFFYFWVIPIYLAWVNLISHIEEDYSLYKKDIKFTYLSIFIGNICTLIFNLSNHFIGVQTGFSCYLEFVIIFFIQCAVLAMTSFLGLLLIQIMDKEEMEDDKTEECPKEITEESSILKS